MPEKMGGERMNDLLVYHGSTEIVEHPICRYGRPNLDFGQGFYVTDLRLQAVEWALQVSARRKKTPYLNRYLLKRDAIIAEAKCKIFDAYNVDWLEFIVSSRSGQNPWEKYDYIEGGVANDRVVDTVNLYMAGLMNLETALNRLALHRPNNQMCLLNQEITDKYLTFDGTENI